MIKVTWKTYGKLEKEKVFDQWNAAESFFWFLQKQQWATSSALTVEG